MDKSRKFNENFFRTSMVFFALCNVTASFIFAYKKPRENEFLFVASTLYFLCLGLCTYPWEKLTFILHVGNVNGWRTLYNSVCVSWIYFRCLDKHQHNDVSFMSCLFLGFVPGIVSYTYHHGNMQKMLAREHAISEISGYTREVLFTYHTSFTNKVDGAKSAQMAMEKMTNLLKSGSAFGTKDGTKGVVMYKMWEVTVCLVIFVSETLFCITFFKQDLSGTTLLLMLILLFMVYTMYFTYISIPSIHETPKTPSAGRNDVVSLFTVVLAIGSTWWIYYLTLDSLAASALAFHVIETFTTWFSRYGTATDIMHASAVFLVCLILNI